MTHKDKQRILQAIDNCEERNKKAFENFAAQNPEHRKRIETNRDLFIFAVEAVRLEIERVFDQNERRLRK